MLMSLHLHKNIHCIWFTQTKQKRRKFRGCHTHCPDISAKQYIYTRGWKPQRNAEQARYLFKTDIIIANLIFVKQLIDMSRSRKMLIFKLMSISYLWLYFIFLKKSKKNASLTDIKPTKFILVFKFILNLKWKVVLSDWFVRFENLPALTFI